MTTRTMRTMERQPPVRDCRAFTIIELLVVMGIVGVLVALTLPGVQRARESARRAECGNRLKHLGTAMHAFEAAQRRFPSFALLDLPPNAPLQDVERQKLVSAHYRLLPYLDLAPLANRIVLTDDVWVFPSLGPPSSSKNDAVIHQALPAFACPSDVVPPGGTSYLLCGGTSTSVHTTPQFPPPNSSLHGITFSQSGVWAQQVRDGLSNTAMFSERLVGDQVPSRYNPMRDVAMVSPADPFWRRPDEAAAGCRLAEGDVTRFNAYPGIGWLFFGFGTTVYNHVLPPNSSTPDCFAGDFRSPGAFTARSFHAGGVLVVMGDGAVRFVGNSVDLAVWRAAATIAGGEPLSLP